MSLINFLNPKLKPSVECEAVCEDGYTAANLIADDSEQLSRGFMGFSVSKPPVEIVFDFPKAIDLKVIKLWHSNGALRSTAFEVHGKYEGIWERVAHVRELGKGVDSVTFCYQSDYSSRSNASTGTAEQSEKVFFFRTAHKILSTTNSLKIIIKATDKCPPVLRKLQVWGLPARTLEKADRELIKTVWNEIIHPYGQQTAEQQGTGQRSSPSRNVPELRDQSTLKIPEEFLDSITWELMIFPTVLPSGKVVDQSTIDKHSEEESKWGRLPSDPFTGLEFTSQRKAIINLALKARIEKFLMENSEQFKTVPRSLGSSRVRRSQNRHASQFASLAYHGTGGTGSGSIVGTYSSLSSNYAKRKTKTSAVTATATLGSETNDTDASIPTPAKRMRRHGILVSSTITTAADNYQLQPTNPSTDACVATALNTTTTTPPPATSSIDLALQQALQKITRFTRPLAEAKPAASCISCRSAQFAYQIQTCKHLVCRECLVELTKAQICICKASFQGADVERYHKL